MKTKRSAGCPFFQILLLSTVFALAATGPADAQTSQAAPHGLPHYHVTELRFPDSPHHGLNSRLAAEVRRDPFEPTVCAPEGLSENDAVTGWIVGADSEPHLFFYQHGRILQINHRAAHDVRAVISDDGIVVATLVLPTLPNQGGFPTRLMLYKEGKLTDITPSGSRSIRATTVPNSRGEFIVSPWGLGDYYLCSTRSPICKSLGQHFLTIVGPNTFVGVGPQTQDGQRGVGAFANKNGVIFWFPQFGKGSGGSFAGAHNSAGESNDAGDFLFDFDNHYYLANASTHKSEEINPPAEAPGKLSQMCVDDRGVVYGLIDADKRARSGTPFIHQNRKSRLLSDVIPHATSLMFRGHAGVLAGTLDNGHLFLYANGATTDIGPLPSPPAQAFVNNRQQVLLNLAIVKAGEIPKIYLATDSQLIDLSTLLPPGADYTLTHGSFINDHGVIVVTAETPIPNARFTLRRAFVLEPENPAEESRPKAGE